MRTSNPLNLLSLRPNTASPSDSKFNTASANGASQAATVKGEKESLDLDIKQEGKDEAGPLMDPSFKQENNGEVDALSEKLPLLTNSGSQTDDISTPQSSVLASTASALARSFKVVVAAVLAPGRFVLACFYDEHGRFSVLMPFITLGRAMFPSTRHRATGREMRGKVDNKAAYQPLQQLRPHRKSTKLSASASQDRFSAMTSESEGDYIQREAALRDSPARNTRSRASPNFATEDSESAEPKRSIKIKAANQDDLRRRRQKRQEGSTSRGSQEPPLTVATIKSPTSPASSLGLTKYPRAPAPPRPLVPRRQASYSTFQPSSYGSQKTLVIDLDETLIHSMAKGGRMSTGHMVEVKLSSPVGVGNTIIAPQVPILYYVHKRPYCDEFLRKVSRWYNLVVFTASVQEYADPVIDWLEMYGKYFSARYYRQHCTYRNGAYIKDLSQVEPDLSKVMILDNSPISYIFHEDNALPIEGWISDPTDNDLLHLIPFLEALQYTSDVRALLALRLGEAP